MRTRYIWSGLTRRFKSNNAAVLHWTAQHCLVSLAGEMWTSIIWYVQQVAVWHCWLACYPRISMLNVSRRVWGGGWLGRGGAHRQRPPGQRDQAGPDQARPGTNTSTYWARSTGSQRNNSRVTLALAREIVDYDKDSNVVNCVVCCADNDKI